MSKQKRAKALVGKVLDMTDKTWGLRPMLFRVEGITVAEKTEVLGSFGAARHGTQRVEGRVLALLGRYYQGDGHWSEERSIKVPSRRAAIFAGSMSDVDEAIRQLNAEIDARLNAELALREQAKKKTEVDKA